jgi:hypothetical protein
MWLGDFVVMNASEVPFRITSADLFVAECLDLPVGEVRRAITAAPQNRATDVNLYLTS